MAVMDYRTQDGLADYGFSMEFQPDIGWRVYVIFLSSYDNDSTQMPYQSIDCNGRRYVNWSAKVDSLGDAKTVAALWAEMIERYLRAHEQSGIGNDTTKGPGALRRQRPDAA
jgi:hypothetical protein